MSQVLFNLDEPNLNGRTYTSEAMQKALEEYNQKGLPMLGEFGLSINPHLDIERVSHKIEDVRIEDGKVIGTVVAMATPYGKMLKTLMDANFEVAYRPRGYGHIDENGIVTNYQIVSIDAMDRASAA